MGGKNQHKPFKIVGAYDSETTNISHGAKKYAFTILHQIGMISRPVQTITSDNVECSTIMHLYRHASDLYAFLDGLAGAALAYVPVIACHNLSFDMYGLAPWLNSHDVRVLAKSKRKPISFTVLDEHGDPALVIWDTLIFSQKSLDYMGKECGYCKLSGAWDYDLIRTPDTRLTDDEKAYASHDVYALLAWVGYWCRLNPDIKPADLGQRVVSKTGIVRRRREQRFGSIKGKGLKDKVGRYWYQLNKANLFSSDDELYTCQAATRGGFTFCSSVNASIPFDLAGTGRHVVGYDATSQHPAQMVSHFYPQGFIETSPDNLTLAFENVCMVSEQDMLDHYSRPFACAFYGAFEFDNLRPKQGTPFSAWGIYPLALARCQEYTPDIELAEDNGQAEEFKCHRYALGYHDQVDGPIYSYGKLESADRAVLWLTELDAWIVSQAYEWNSVHAVSGYITMKYARPSDMSTISVMQFYSAKNEFKKARKAFYSGKPITNVEELRACHIPEFVITGMQKHDLPSETVESTYLGLKADLNSLFGVEASNEYRRDTVLTRDGIDYTGPFGISNEPKKPKAFYQFGQRVVGWSRIAQCLILMLAYPHVDTCINGDTDSVKFLVDDDSIGKLEDALGVFADAIDKAKAEVCTRVKRCYPEMYNPLVGIGHYIREFKTGRFCASWNKSYVMEDDKGCLRFTLAGLPTAKVEDLAEQCRQRGWSFSRICNTFLGCNVTYAHDITGLNARCFPDWGDECDEDVTDYKGNKSHVHEPLALCLYPMVKTINDTQRLENAVNMRIALQNNPDISIEPTIISSDGIYRIGVSDGQAKIL